mgnify:CR=1 FL=1
MELIAVVLKGKTSDERFSDAKSLLNYGFSTWSLVTVTPDEVLPPVPVTLGVRGTVQPVLTSENTLLVEKTLANGLTKEVALAETSPRRYTQATRSVSSRCATRRGTRSPSCPSSQARTWAM